MRSIRFFGAAGTVTGSSHLLTGNNGTQVLVDLGMFQGAEEISKLNILPLGFKPSLITAVLLTHAHLDHCGRLPLLVKGGFTGKIYMTKATRMLAALALADAAKVAAEDYAKLGLSRQVLYTVEDVEKVLQKIEIVEYESLFTIGEFKVVFRDAGHILGSASIEISDTGGKRIVFSGDLGNSPEDIVRPTEQINQADYVVMESTYGDKIHKEEDPSRVLQEEINTIEKDEGVLLIPAFSIERTQEILHRINHLKNNKLIAEKTEVFLDSPMAIRATEIFKRSADLYNMELVEEAKTDDPFNFPGLVLTATAEESKNILLAAKPKIIISGSGMMSGGRVLHHALNYLPDPHTRLLVVGYQATGTMGWQLLNGAKKVTIYRQEVAVNGSIREVEAMSCHADQPKLLQWLGHIKNVKKVFLTHGEDGSRQVLGEKIKSELGIQDVALPKLGEEVRFLT